MLLAILSTQSLIECPALLGGSRVHQVGSDHVLHSLLVLTREPGHAARNFLWLLWLGIEGLTAASSFVGFHEALFAGPHWEGDPLVLVALYTDTPSNLARRQRISSKAGKIDAHGITKAQGLWHLA